MARPDLSMRPTRWLAIGTLALAGGAAIQETAREQREWSVFLISAVGIAAGLLAFNGHRGGGVLGAVWGVMAGFVLILGPLGERSFSWVGRQMLYVYLGTPTSDPGTQAGSTFAVNVFGLFLACAWGWYAMQPDEWPATRPARRVA